MNTITRQLAEFVVGLKLPAIPTPVLHEAKRSLLNYFAVGFAGCHDRTIEIAKQAYAEFAGPAQAAVFGTAEKSDLLTAAALNAMSANVFDFDDTHTPTIIHPTAPVAAALLSLGHRVKMTGEQFLVAFLIGVEVQCRLGNVISPYHYSRGWHITSTCAVIGVAAAVGKILGLNAQQLVWAMGIAANQAGGLVECLGTMSKSVSVGNAARHGLMSALLASRGFDGPLDPLVGVRGFVRVYGDNSNPAGLVKDLGVTWEIMQNTYKPYPCGVVLNPVLDACLALSVNTKVRLRHGEDIEQIVLTGHPLLRQRTDRPQIFTGRESQVCAQHAVAMTLLSGKAGLDEFSDAAVNDARVRALGAKTRFQDDLTYSVDSATVELVFVDGTVLREHVQHARGSVNNPLSDAALVEKLATLSRYGRVNCDVSALSERILSLQSLDDVTALMSTI